MRISLLFKLGAFSALSLLHTELAFAVSQAGDTEEINGVERSAAVVMENQSGPPMKVFLTEEHEKQIRRNKATMAQHGYIEKLDQPPRVEYIRDRMNERRQAIRLQGRSENLESLGFTDLDSVAYSKLPFAVTLLDPRYVNSNSEKYLLMGGHKIKQLYTQTDFGSVIIDEMPNSTATLSSANMEINGSPATFTHIRHKDDKWASVIYATRGDKLFVVEADRRLTGDSKAAFIDMVAGLVASSN